MTLTVTDAFRSTGLGDLQRRRVLDAMIRIASRYGYSRASVARVIEEAGSSRSAFYARFGGRTDCFLAAYRDVVERMRASVGSAAERSAPGARPGAVIDALLAEATENPASARLVLVEALAAPPSVRAEHERLIADIERMIDAFILDQAGAERSLRVPAAALLAGVGGIVSIRVLRGELGSLPALREDLLAWVDAYRLHDPGVKWGPRAWEELERRFPPEPGEPYRDPALLPRGRSALPPETAAAARRQRILDATAKLTAAGGYSALRVSDIVRVARVPRGAFYSHFRGKQDAFHAAQTGAMQEGMAAAASQFSVPAPWPERIWNAGRAFFGYVGRHPELAYLDFVETYAVGPEAILVRHENQMAFTLFLEEGYRQGPAAERLPRIASEAIASAIYGLMRRQVLRGRTEMMPAVLPAATYTILAPFIGPEPAMEFIEAKVRAAAPAA
jgi:AcrR family transcriptional regulator